MSPVHFAQAGSFRSHRLSWVVHKLNKFLALNPFSLNSSFFLFIYLFFLQFLSVSGFEFSGRESDCQVWGFGRGLLKSEEGVKKANFKSKIRSIPNRCIEVI